MNQHPSTPCLSTLALEALAVGSAAPELSQHAATCQRCHRRLNALAHQVSDYRPSDQTVAAVVERDRRWVRRAAFATEVPLAAAILAVTVYLTSGSAPARPSASASASGSGSTQFATAGAGKAAEETPPPADDDDDDEPEAGSAPGSIDKDVVKAVINSHLPEVGACYEHSLGPNTAPIGKLVLGWQITATGSVALPKVKTNDSVDASIVSCILAALKTWQFPAPRGGGVVNISYPFVFSVEGEP